MTKKITELPAATTPLAGTEQIEIVQGGASKNVSVSHLGVGAVVTDATTARTLALGDYNAWIRFTSASAVTLTIPLNATVAWGINRAVEGVQAAAGQVTFTAAGGVTLNVPTGYNAKTRAQGSSWGLIKVATDAWDLVGDLEATA